MLARQVAGIHANVDKHRLATIGKETSDLDRWGRKTSVEARHDKRLSAAIELA